MVAHEYGQGMKHIEVCGLRVTPLSLIGRERRRKFVIYFLGIECVERVLSQRINGCVQCSKRQTRILLILLIK